VNGNGWVPNPFKRFDTADRSRSHIGELRRWKASPMQEASPGVFRLVSHPDRLTPFQQDD
jgi:hypothetical protein